MATYRLTSGEDIDLRIPYRQPIVRVVEAATMSDAVAAWRKWLGEFASDPQRVELLTEEPAIRAESATSPWEIAAQAEPPPNRQATPDWPAWVDINEQPPPINKPVLAWNCAFGGRVECGLATGITDAKRYTHWMPLPEGPKS